MSSLEVARRPFAAFFEEALTPSWVAVELVRPRANVVGTARLPRIDDGGAGLRLGLCVECLRPRGECVCD
jgi:hypothetical protein